MLSCECPITPQSCGLESNRWINSKSSFSILMGLLVSLGSHLYILQLKKNACKCLIASQVDVFLHKTSSLEVSLDKTSSHEVSLNEDKFWKMEASEGQIPVRRAERAPRFASPAW